MTDEHITLREFIERIISEREKQTDLRFENFEHRLVKLNELREEVMKDRSMYVTQEKYDVQHKALGEKLDDMASFRNKAIGASIILGILAGEIGGIVGHLLR